MSKQNRQLDLISDTNEADIKSFDFKSDDVLFVRNFLGEQEATDLFESLMDVSMWRQDHIRICGKDIPLPRLHRWFTTSDEPYEWSGIEMIPEPFPDKIKSILDRLNNETGICFNTALGNLYRDGKDSVSWHSDDEPDLGPNPVIASLSLGVTRRFYLRKKEDRSVMKSFDLNHGSLLIMGGNTQNIWEHSLVKTEKKAGVRINLTFRAITVPEIIEQEIIDPENIETGNSEEKHIFGYLEE